MEKVEGSTEVVVLSPSLILWCVFSAYVFNYIAWTEAGAD